MFRCRFITRRCSPRRWATRPATCRPKRTTRTTFKKKSSASCAQKQERTTKLNDPLAELDLTFTDWLGANYDLDAIHLTLAAAAAIKLDGDPLWTLLVSGPGNAKTETVITLAEWGARVVSSIASPGALLSATSKGECTKDSTGGLLNEIGDSAVLVFKDYTSILSLPASA